MTKELQSLDDAQTVDIRALRENISKMGSKLAQIKKRLDYKKNIWTVGDNFANVMRPFYEKSIEKYKKLETKRDEMFKDLKDLGIWLDEPNDDNFGYLTLLNEFRKKFVLLAKKLQKKKEELAEIKKRKQ